MGEKMVKQKKHKTKDEWKKLILSLTPQEFEDLCFDIIRNNNFKNPRPRGKAADGGRDIEAEFTYKITSNKEITEKCWFQCKRQEKGVTFKQFSTEVQKAQDQGVTKFFIISNSDLTSDAKTDIENWNKNNKCQIIDWTGTLFLDLLFELRDVCKFYFPDEEVPPVVNPKEPKEIIPLSSNLGKRFGIELKLNVENINVNNPIELADTLRETLLKLDKVDINIKSLIYEKISMFFFSINKSDDALMFLNKSLDITPKNVNALLNKGYILEKIDKVNESNECYDEILTIDEKNIFALNNKSFNLRRQGKLDEALKLVDKALKINPNFILAIKNKVEILKGLKKIDEALDFLEEKKSCFAKSIDLMTLKVQLYIDRLDLKEAFKINEEILKRDKENLAALNNKGVIFERNARFQKSEKYLSLALECFEKLIKKNREWPLAWSNKTVVLINTFRLEEAEKIIDFAYSLFPKNPQILNKKGVLLLAKKQPKKALKYFQMALNLFYQEEFLLNKAWAQLKLRQWSQAKDTCDKLLKYNPEKSEAWEIKGHALRHLHQITMSKICFNNAEKFKEKPISLLED